MFSSVSFFLLTYLQKNNQPSKNELVPLVGFSAGLNISNYTDLYKTMEKLITEGISLPLF